MRATDGDDDGYYESWAKYPDDQGVPPEIAQLLREVGDGEPDMWKTKPPWCQPWTILLTGTAERMSTHVSVLVPVSYTPTQSAPQGAKITTPSGVATAP